MRDIWINRREFEGQGTVVIPSDPVALTERLIELDIVTLKLVHIIARGIRN